MGHESGFGASRRAAAVQKNSSRHFRSFGYKCITFRNPQRCLELLKEIAPSVTRAGDLAVDAVEIDFAGRSRQPSAQMASERNKMISSIRLRLRSV
jgi:hypothetical protein